MGAVSAYGNLPQCVDCSWPGFRGLRTGPYIRPVSESERPMRGEGGKFVKGHPQWPGSGGRRMTDEQREAVRLCREHSVRAVQRLYQLLTESEDENVALKAAKEILDRGLGKPTQAIQLTTDERKPIDEMSGREKVAHLEDVRDSIEAELAATRAAVEAERVGQH